MVGVVKTGIMEGDTLVLVDEQQDKVIDYFRVTNFSANRDVTIEDSNGRVFTYQNGKDFWIHPKVLIEFPKQILAKCNEHGYKYSCRIHTNDNLRIHFAGFLKKTNPELFAQLPNF